MPGTISMARDPRYTVIWKATKLVNFVISADWKLPFEIMCDASDYAVGAVLGQRLIRNWMLFIMLVEHLMLPKEIMLQLKKNF